MRYKNFLRSFQIRFVFVLRFVIYYVKRKKESGVIDEQIGGQICDKVKIIKC